MIKIKPLALLPLLVVLALPLRAEEFSLDMRGADLREFIQTIAQMTGKTIIADPKVRGKVDIQSPHKLSREELYEVFLVQLSLNGFSVVDTQNGILKVIPAQGAKLEGSEVALGVPERSSEQVVTRVVEVQNVNANQLAATLRPLIDNRLGIIAAYETSNVILITDRASNVRRIAQIIKEVDRADSQTLELIPLRNASASELERILQSLTRNQAGKPKAGAAAVITSDQRTNTLIVKADAVTRNRIRRIVNELDDEVETTANTQVTYLKYAKASEVVPVLKGISDTIIKEEQQKQGSKGPERLTSNLNIDAHEATNSVVMSGSPHIIKTLEGIIKKLDIRRAQVLVEAVIAEVSEDKAKELGVQWLVYDGSQDSTVPAGTVNFRSQTSAGIVDIAGAIDSDNFSPGSIGNGATFGIGSINSNGLSVAAFINALESDSDSNVLSTPSVVTLDNQEASIQVGQEVPILTGSTASSTNSNPFQTIERKDIGIKLKVTPQINEGDAILLDIEQEVSSLSRDAQASDIITNERVIKTSVLVDDRGTITLGGLIDEDVIDTSSKVPLLGDIPYLGKLFSSQSSTRNKRTLVVFIRPTIIRNQSLAANLSRQKYNYIHAQQELLREADRGLYDNTPTIEKWRQEQTIPDLRSLGDTRQQPLPPIDPEKVEVIERSFSRLDG